MNDKKDNKKMNDKNGDRLLVSMTDSLWGDLPPSAWEELKLEDFATPTAPLPTLVALGKALADRIGPDATAGEKRSGKAMLGACELGGRAIEYNRLFEVRTAEKPLRPLVVRLSANVIDTLDVQVRSPVAAVAETAVKLKTGVFGDDFRPGNADAAALHQRLCEVEGALTRNPSLREALEGAVPAVLVTELLEANRQLGQQVMRKKDERAVDDGVDLRKITVGVRQRTGEYVVNVLATVDIAQQETVARAKRLLRPLTALRAELTAKRSRRARLAAGQEVEEDEIAEEVEETDAISDGEEEVAEPAPAQPGPAQPGPA